MTSRGLDSEVELKSDYRIYMVMNRITTKDGTAVPWHSYAGGAIQSALSNNSYYDHVDYQYVNSCATLILSNSLLRILVIKSESRTKNNIC